MEDLVAVVVVVKSADTAVGLEAEEVVGLVMAFLAESEAESVVEFEVASAALAVALATAVVSEVATAVVSEAALAVTALVAEATVAAVSHHVTEDSIEMDPVDRSLEWRC
eukprot:c9588_g1_i3.p5 GENE.c9588_g1_i3~~c9588_g1_i3.p5  ORF type:complete len:110 (-),score=39.20 c9588_g1_i3:882-1211(-)